MAFPGLAPGLDPVVLQTSVVVVVVGDHSIEVVDEVGEAVDVVAGVPGPRGVVASGGFQLL